MRVSAVITTSLRQIVQRWDNASDGEKRGMIDSVVDRVIVKDGALYALVLRGDISLILSE